MLAGALTLGTFLVGATSMARAATEYFNPFDVNGGFSILAQGDVTLGNGELEGSVAATGAINSSKQNYPVLHHVGGMADYEVPRIDGVPVRILANEFAGVPAGEPAIEQTNSGAVPGSPEDLASAKFVVTDNLRGSARGSNFLRVTNDDSGVLDLTKVSYSDDAIAALKTDRASVGAYFPDMDQRIAAASQCLAGYVPGNDQVNFPTLSGDPLTLGGWASDRPNVINYDDIEGANVVKPEGYFPTADAPLVIKFPAGTTEIGVLNFEGWSASGAQQAYARHIILDLSDVTGTVRFGDHEMGAVWAPNANLHFTGSRSTNGQWVSQDFTTTAGSGGELHHHTFAGLLPCGETDETPEP
ncbi:collagen-binding domain-containing protein, partial [Tessaracoccus rhinocerotis]|uniref:collagen-binding domain-containing protein n=1 Tax=Tessaracoccus rhinocerotis TaxID=1689449 RepID=UPI00163D8086